MPSDAATRDAAKRRILTLVAEGHLSPSDAADQLAALEAPPGTGAAEDGPGAGAAAAGADPAGPPGETRNPSPRAGSVAGGDDARPGAPIRTVKVSATARSVVIVGDAAVREAVAQGSRYEQHYDGDTVVINSDLDIDPEDTFSRFHVHHAPGGSRKIVIDGRKGFMQAKAAMRETLVIRMHPDLALRVEVAAGSLSVSGVHGPVKANVAAGSMKIDDFEGPLEVDVAAGSVKGAGRLDHGDSRVVCAMGSVKLDLDAASSVRIVADASLGSVKLPGRPFKAEKDGFGVSETQETVIGDGTGVLRIETNLGSVKIGFDGDR